MHTPPPPEAAGRAVRRFGDHFDRLGRIEQVNGAKRRFAGPWNGPARGGRRRRFDCGKGKRRLRSEEHTSELQSLMRISYAVFCLKKKKRTNSTHTVTYRDYKLPQHNHHAYHVSCSIKNNN